MKNRAIRLTMLVVAIAVLTACANTPPASPATSAAGPSPSLLAGR